MIVSSLYVLSLEKLQGILSDSKRIGTSLDFIRMIETAIHQKKLNENKH